MPDRGLLFRQSVIVTGTHYSMSTLTGQILGTAPEFHVIHEPLNAEPTLGYAALAPDHWYEFYDDDRYDTLRNALYNYASGCGIFVNTFSRLPKVRSKRDVLRVGKFALTNLKLLQRPRRVVFKDPFLAFSASQLQDKDDLYAVICVRHPCGFAESLKRRGKGFDFTDLAAQPALMEAVPDIASDIQRFATTKQPLVAQAALLWRAVYGFAAERMLNNPRTSVLRQEDMAADPVLETDRIFSAVGATRTRKVDEFLRNSLSAQASDFTGKSYTKRNARDTANKWRERLPPDEIATVMQISGSVPALYGYSEPLK